jgi:hypothetical protein
MQNLFIDKVVRGNCKNRKNNPLVINLGIRKGYPLLGTIYIKITYSDAFIKSLQLQQYNMLISHNEMKILTFKGNGPI